MGVSAHIQQSTKCREIGFVNFRRTSSSYLLPLLYNFMDSDIDQEIIGTDKLCRVVALCSGFSNFICF